MPDWIGPLTGLRSPGVCVMPIHLTCPGCEAKGTLPDAAAGYAVSLSWAEISTLRAEDDRES